MEKYFQDDKKVRNCVQKHESVDGRFLLFYKVPWDRRVTEDCIRMSKQHKILKCMNKIRQKDSLYFCCQKVQNLQNLVNVILTLASLFV